MKRVTFLALGWLFLALGMVGVFVPLLPTTPFVLLAAYCFSKSSERFHQMLLNSQLFGHLIADWQAYGVIGLRAKIIATFSMVILISLSAFRLGLPVFIKLLLAVTAVGVLIFIWSRPSRCS